MSNKIIEQTYKNAPTSAGVYRMLDDNGVVLYVGKDRNLKNRLANYTHPEKLDPRIVLMLSQTKKMELISTASEHEALILEADFIKKLKPKYNIIFRDDKSYPYILLTNEEFPKLVKHRGAKKIKGEYFGPFYFHR